MYFAFLFGRIHFFPKKTHSLVKIQWIRYSSEMKHYSPRKIIIPFMIILMLYFKQAYENNYISSCRPNICFQVKNVNFESSQISFVFHPRMIIGFFYCSLACFFEHSHSKGFLLWKSCLCSSEYWLFYWAESHAFNRFCWIIERIVFLALHWEGSHFMWFYFLTNHQHNIEWI